MKYGKMLLVGMAAAAMTTSAVSAGDVVKDAAEEAKEAAGGLLDSLFGEGGLLEDVLPEEAEVSELVGSIKEELGQAGDGISEALADVSEKIQSASEDLDLDSLKAYAEDLLEQIPGGGDLLDQFTGSGDGGADSFDLDAIFRAYEQIREDENEYYMEQNADLMDPGDVQIVTNGTIAQSGLDEEEIRTMSSMIQCNYTADDENQLWMTSGSGVVILFTQTKDEDGSYPVVEAVYSEDGEGYTDSLRAMCDEMGISLEEALDSIAFNDAYVMQDMKDYLTEHPEYTGIEYTGEIRTADELEAMWNDAMMELYGDEIGEADADSAEEPVTAYADSAEEPAAASADSAEEIA